MDSQVQAVLSRLAKGKRRRSSAAKPKRQAIETAIKRDAGRQFDLRGYWYERVQSGGPFEMVRGGWMQCAKAGFPDWWTPWGLIEWKKPGGKLSAEQKACHARLRAHGVDVQVFDAVRAALDWYAGKLADREHEKAMGWR